MAVNTSHTDDVLKPPSARENGTSPTKTTRVTPIKTSGAPASGCSIRPAIVVRNTAVVRQPAGVTPVGGVSP